MSPDALRAELRGAATLRLYRARKAQRETEVKLAEILQLREFIEVEVKEALVELERWRS